MSTTALATDLRDLDLHTPDGVCDARIAVPREAGSYPGVLFCMDAFGLRPAIDAWIARIAAHGYVVLAPNLLYRSSRSPVVDDVVGMMSEEKRPALFGLLMPMMQLLTPENSERDAIAYIDCLASLPGVSKGPVGVTGYCMGARMAIRVGAAKADRVAAIAGFHGGNLATAESESPHLLAAKLSAEVYLAYADHDQGATPEQQTRMDDALAAAGLEHKSEVYPGAPHGYTMADTAAYRQWAAEKHFHSLLELFARRLKG